MEEQLLKLIKDSEIDRPKILAIGLDEKSFTIAKKEQAIIYEDDRWHFSCITILRTNTITVISRF